ncbi:HNH endonuclease [Deinococcus sp. Marseille-Q6407]|uniref:HNH endonuclease n=1 Tax=Deinococcus sp. Marseille-Q6407 TaxID=2969223 RepID=UPI0021C10DE7|nr:HNH endonuclease [Deinococcus sp. Marseille-Q6407]
MARRAKAAAWPPPAAAPAACALCGREVPRLTEHHLVPRSQGRRRGLKVAELPTVMLCPACHKYLHTTFSNQELETGYSSLEALREHEGVQKFVAWIRKQPASKGVRVR